MRQDLHKVIIDLPRGGSRMRNRKSRLHLHGNQVNSWTDEKLEDHDSGPNRFPMSMRAKYSGHYGEKDFSDRLNPLRRFLRSQVGRRWDDVYSEMVQHTDTRSMVGRHFWIHVFQYVELECHLEKDGKVYDNITYSYRGKSETTGFYVHPTTGILCYKETPSFRQSGKYRFERKLIKLGFSQFDYRSYREDKKDSSVFRIVSDEIVLEKKPGGWFIHNIHVHKTSDVIGWDWTTTGVRIPVYWKDRKGAPSHYIGSSRQLGKKDLKKYHEIIAGNPF